MRSLIALSRHEPARAESASKLFKHGEAAEAREDYDTALDLYQKALAKAPKDLTYKTALYRVRVSASAVHMTKGRKLLAAATSRARWRSFCTPRRSTPATRPRSRRSPSCASSTAKPQPQGDTSAARKTGRRRAGLDGRPGAC